MSLEVCRYDRYGVRPGGPRWQSWGITQQEIHLGKFDLDRTLFSRTLESWLVRYKGNHPQMVLIQWNVIKFTQINGDFSLAVSWFILIYNVVPP